MRKQVFGRQFKRDINERKALFKGLASSLVLHERITTTEEKAKAIKGHVEKLVTKAKRTDLRHAQSLLEPYLTIEAVEKVLHDIAPRFANRPGGYTRIMRVGRRFNDNAQMVFIEWVEKSSKLKVQNAKLDAKDKGETVSADAAVAAALHGGKEEKVTKKQSGKVAKKETKKTAKKEHK
ncbi:MAG: 50S ribosomal protein L17 [Candidatus Levybacteria bacterium]|nr:50S ribosomal protein L17 [Candidatus Levybacteria bacterium]